MYEDVSKVFTRCLQGHHSSPLAFILHTTESLKVLVLLAAFGALRQTADSPEEEV